MERGPGHGQGLWSSEAGRLTGQVKGECLASHRKGNSSVKREEQAWGHRGDNADLLGC